MERFTTVLPYQLAGWVIDTESKQIIIYEFKDKEIQKFNIYQENEIIKSNRFSGLEIDISQMFNSVE